MRWAFIIQQKLKVAVMLICVMLMVILFNLIERRNIEAINKSMTSIYKDRLIPAADIFYLTESVYNKRIEAEKFLASDNYDLKLYQKNSAEQNKTIHSLLEAFNKTYLVNEEQSFLKEFQSKTDKYNLLEQEMISLVLAGRKPDAHRLYESEARNLLTANIHNLSALARIQTKVGTELMNDSKGIVATSDMLSMLQMSLAIVIGIMIVALVSASKLVSPAPQQNFNLN